MYHSGHIFKDSVHIQQISREQLNLHPLPHKINVYIMAVVTVERSHLSKAERHTGVLVSVQSVIEYGRPLSRDHLKYQGKHGGICGMTGALGCSPVPLPVDSTARSQNAGRRLP